MLELIGVKTDSGYYVSTKDQTYNGRSLNGFIVNGEIPKATFHFKKNS